MNERDRLFLEHIAEAIRRVREYTSAGRDAFFADRKTQDAVIRQLEIIGEAARSVSDELKQQHPEIPWRAMIGNRDRLIHGYFQVLLDRVWTTVADDIPRLDGQIEAVKATKPDDSGQT